MTMSGEEALAEYAKPTRASSVPMRFWCPVSLGKTAFPSQEPDERNDHARTPAKQPVHLEDTGTPVGARPWALCGPWWPD